MSYSQNRFILIKPTSLAQLRLIQKAFLSTSQPQCASDNPMLKMGPYPRTPEERLRAAKKYNLIPEDYEPYEEGEGWGDYPKLKPVGGYNRDKYDNFDDLEEHRFYGEPWNLDDDMYRWERIDPYAEEKEMVPPWKQLFQVLVLFWTVPGVYLFFKTFNIHPNHNWKKRTLHPPDQKYYQFPSSSHH